MTKSPTKTRNELSKYFDVKEISDRRRYIQTLKTFAGAYEAAGKALEAIKQRRLWRPYSSIREFCEQECGWTVRRLNQVVAYTRLKSKLPPESGTMVPNERVARELARVPEDQREAVLAEASKNGKVTAKVVKEIVDKLLGTVEPVEDEAERVIIDLDKTGYPIPESALMVWKRRAEPEKILNVLKQARDMMQELMQMQSGPNPDLLYAGVHCNGIYAKLANACREFKEAIPYAVCTTCQGIHPETCNYCKGRGMISKLQFERMSPEEIAEIRKKAHESTDARSQLRTAPF
jgi:hypothetical protein